MQIQPTAQQANLRPEAASKQCAPQVTPLTRKFRKQGGFTLPELFLTLVVVVILLGLGFIVFQKVNRMISVNDNLTQITTMAGAAQSTYGRTNQYGLVTTAVAVQGHVIPSELRDGTAATATNKFGGAVTVAPATSGAGGANDMLAVTWPNVPSDQCSDIVSGVAGAMRRIAVNGTDVKTLDTAISPVLASTQCEAATNVTIVFYIGRS